MNISILAMERGKETKIVGRGGCLDAVVKVATLGQYGVETTTSIPPRIIPTNLPTQVGDSVPLEDDSATMRAIRSGQSVVVNNFEAANRPQVTRRIVKNKP